MPQHSGSAGAPCMTAAQFTAGGGMTELYCGDPECNLGDRIDELERQLADRDLRLDYLRNLAQVGTLVTDGYRGNPRLVKHALWGETFEWPEGTAE